MGDRANVAVIQHDFDKTKAPTTVYLYSHWGGYDLPFVVQEVLQRRQRWDDESYLTRMIFSAMIQDSIGKETGYGISTYMCDNDRNVIVVDTEEQSISFVKGSLYEKGELDPMSTFSFDNFCNLSESQMNKAYHGEDWSEEE